MKNINRIDRVIVHATVNGKPAKAFIDLDQCPKPLSLMKRIWLWKQEHRKAS